MLVQRKTSNDASVEVVPTHRILNTYRTFFRSLHRLKPGRRYQIFNDDEMPGIDTRPFFASRRGSVDVIYLHWIARLLSSELLSRIVQHYQCPVVWVPMDAEPFTGGCHYPGVCTRFTAQCGQCPVLGSSDQDDRSRTVWLNKHRNLTPLPITFVSATSWISAQIRASSLFGNRDIEEIALPIDTEIFRPADKTSARAEWNLDPAARIIMIGAQRLDNPRKGMRELSLALSKLKTLTESDTSARPSPLLLIVGSGASVFTDLPYPARFVEQVTDKKRLASLYRSADVYICPSLDDAGPMMIPEAMLCGTPVVAFEMGGAPDLIVNDTTGYMAALGDADDLAQGLFRVLYLGDGGLGARAHAAAYERHHPAFVVQRHLALCRRLGAAPYVTTAE
jgi:glycosyltransferase involved in cell wall biosynthesis